MDDRPRTDGDAETTAVDVSLFKAIGLHQLLWPGRGRAFRNVVAALMAVSLAVLITQLAGLYVFSNDFQRFAFLSVVVVYSSMCLLKGRVLLVNADRLRGGLELAAYAFTSSGRRDPSRLRRCRALLGGLLRTFTAISYATLAVWLLAPWIVGGHATLIRLDGTVAEHRTNIFGLWVPVSEATYNSQPVWALIYATEVVMCTLNVVVWLLFDCYVMTMCYVLNAQFRAVADEYETLGRRSSGAEIEDTMTPADHYDKLICSIKVNQKIIEKYNEFFDIFRPVVLLQITSGSYTVIMLVFLLLMTHHLMGMSVVSGLSLKLFTGGALLATEVFIYCYIFNYIETAKSKVNFGLYSSDWTAMDLKFKKTVLLAMNMNSAHNRLMKIKPDTVVNLELFAKVTKLSYSIVSVLLKSNS